MFSRTLRPSGVHGRGKDGKSSRIRTMAILDTRLCTEVVELVGRSELLGAAVALAAAVCDVVLELLVAEECEAGQRFTVFFVTFLPAGELFLQGCFRGSFTLCRAGGCLLRRRFNTGFPLAFGAMGLRQGVSDPG